MKIVRMVQTSKYAWHIENQQGIVLKRDITFNNAYKAEEHVKCYISSFSSWDYELVPMKEIAKVNKD